MDSLLNPKRPPVFCPGCAHQNVVKSLDRALQQLGRAGTQVAIVSDIGCSGLFDTFFNTHALHGLHGRALTYAIGLKMARPELTVVVTMGDGGMGIGGAHVLSACRRNLDITLLVLNNFNYGMTGGQCSATTPAEATVGSGFLNQLEQPLDVCQVTGAAGAAWVERISAYDPKVVDRMVDSLQFEGFSVLDIWGVCPGRYTKRNPLNPKTIQMQLDQLPPLDHFRTLNARTEYGHHYRQAALKQPQLSLPDSIEKQFEPLHAGRQEILMMGSAGQRIVTAGELLCLAGATAGLRASQKNDYPITVLRGHSISEIILSSEEIGYTGSDQPAVILALADEGVARRPKLWAALGPQTLVIRAADVLLPQSAATIVDADFKAAKIGSADRALSGLAILAARQQTLSVDMLQVALSTRFKGKTLEKARSVLDRTVEIIEVT